MSRPIKLVVAIVAVVAIIAAIRWLPVGAWIAELVAWAHGLGAIGLVAYALVFVACCILLVPTTPIYLAAGLLYGRWWGALVTTLLGVVVELVTVMILQTRLRAPLERRIAKHPWVAAIERACGESSWIVVLLRFSPIVPFGPLNYVLAMAKIPLWKRVVTNIAGMGPNCLVTAYVGSLLVSAGRLDSASAPPLWKHLALAAGIASVVIASVLAARATRRILGEG